jgi:NADH-quinone oxidoreductase subunit E
MAVLTPELRAEAERIVARYPEGRERSAIMPLLYLVQSVEGHVTRDGLREVADILDATTA